MADVYKTKSGDTWDVIAKLKYGTESAVSFLMENNQSLLLDYFIFPAGVELAIEEMPEEETSTTLPDWRY